jgi:AcrR family transcriptional regulator
VPEQSPLPPIDLDDGPAGRIIATTRELLLRDRYSGLTMNGLAFALGMSKKTLYAHFASKDAIISAVIAATGATIRRQVMAVMALPDAFPAKFKAVLGIIGAQFGPMGPDFLQDLHRHAPHLAREIDTLKDNNIPIVFDLLLREGIAEGMVRPDTDIPFATAYWIQIIKGIHDPAVLAQTGLTPRAAFDKSIERFFRGLLTGKGLAASQWA